VEDGVDVEARYEEGRVVWCGFEYTGKVNE